MAFFDRHPTSFRLLFALVAVGLLWTSSVNIYRSATVATDENVFAVPPSHLYIAKQIPAAPLKIEQEEFGANDVPRDPVVGGPRAGDLLLAVDGKPVDSISTVLALMQASPDDSVDIDIFRLSAHNQGRFRVHIDRFPENFVYRLAPVAHVIEVTEDGASDRAGMQRGDLILRVNGRSFNSVQEADRILRDAKIGSIIEYEVLRDNQVLALDVEVVSFGLSLVSLVLYLCGLLTMAIGMLFGFLRPTVRGPRLLSLAFVLIGYFVATFFVRPFATEYELLLVVRDIAATLSPFLGLPLWIHATYLFPNRRKCGRWRILTPYLISTATLVLVFSMQIFAQESIGGTMFPLMLGVLLVFKLGTDVFDAVRSGGEFGIAERILAYGSYGSILIALGCVIAGLSSDNEVLLGMAGPAIVIMPLTHVFVVLRFRLLDFTWRMRRGTQYLILSSIWNGAMFVLIVTAVVWVAMVEIDLPQVRVSGGDVEIVRGPMTAGREHVVETLFKMCVGIGLLALIWNLRGRVQRHIDQKFHRSRLDFGTAGARLTEVLVTKLSARDLARELAAQLSEIVRIKRVAVVLIREGKVNCFGIHGIDERQWEAFCHEYAGRFVKAVGQLRTEFNVDILPRVVRDALRPLELSYIIPMRSDDVVVGAVFIGETMGEQALSWDELSFLNSAARQSALTIENVFLYDDLAVQERLKHELSIARRIQLESLPQQTPLVGGLDMAGISIPALEVGGDFYEYLSRADAPREISIVIGDVSGKGTSAALYMAKVQGILRTLYDSCKEPRAILAHLNRLLIRDMARDSFITATVAHIDADTMQMRMARAGHVPLFHYHASDGSISQEAPQGPGLGLVRGETFGDMVDEVSSQLAPGDILVFMTDGIIEARGAGADAIGEEELRRLLEGMEHRSAHYIRDKIITSIQNLTDGDDQLDDQTLVIVKVRDAAQDGRK